MRCVLNVRPPTVVLLVAMAFVGMPRSAFGQQSPAPAPTPPAAPAPAPPPAAAVLPQSTPAASPVPAPSPAEMRHRRVAVDVESTQPSTVIERRVSVTESEGAYFFLPFQSR